MMHATAQKLEPAPSSTRYGALPRTIVTGATSGIGLALARQLTHAGVPVVAIGRNREALRELAQGNPLVAPCAADLSALDQLPGLAARLLQDHPDVGGLIHNAGIQCDLRLDDAACTPQALRQEVDVNLLAPMVLTRLLLSHLQARGQAGAPAFVVNVTSGLAFAPKRTAAAYSATKAGLHLFSRGLRVQLAGTPVRVVEAVMPLVDTPMTAGRGQGKLPAEQAARALLDGLAAGRSTVYIGKARFVPLLHRWAPAVLDRVLQRA